MAVIAQCPSCRMLIAVERVVVDGDRAGLRCSACQAVAWLPTAHANSALPAPSALPVVTALPPATIELPPPLALPASALVPIGPVAPAVMAPASAATFDDDVLARISARLAPPADDAPRQHELAGRFAKLLTQWHSEVEHKQLLKAAAASDELAFIGSRYRAVLDVVRDDPRARTAQQELITLAMATMSTSRSLAPADEPKSNTAKIVVAVVAVLVAALVFGVAVKKMLATVEQATAAQ